MKLRFSPKKASSFAFSLRSIRVFPHADMYTSKHFEP